MIDCLHLDSENRIGCTITPLPPVCLLLTIRILELGVSNGDQLEDTSELITGLVDRGLGCYMSGLDNVRNVVGNPMAGIDPLEDYDTRQLWYALSFLEAEGKGRGKDRGWEGGGRGDGR